MIVSLIRSIILYTLIIIAIRLMGKRQIGELQPGELAITILISNIAVLPIENIDVPLILGIVPIFTLVCFELALSSISLKSNNFRKLLSGKPVFVIEDGKINQKALLSLRFTLDDLTEGLRSCEVFDVSQVAYAVVETNGTMSVLKKFSAQTVTAEMMRLEDKKTVVPMVVISDGKLVNENLQMVGLDNEWIFNRIKKENLDVNDIFLMTVDRDENVYLARKEKI